MGCLGCGRGFHDECDDNPCCCNTASSPTDNVSGEGEQKAERDPSDRRRENVTISAGRKRAAVDYEIDPTAPCDWRGKANCGGGFIPVVGCIIGYQTDRHHGPDKDTTNNSEENVHLICKPCHNLWHRRNDPEYGGRSRPEGIELHNPRWATEHELLTKDPL